MSAKTSDRIEWLEALEGGVYPPNMGETVSPFRPIADAPRDGTRLLLALDSEWEVGRYNTYRMCWLDCHFNEIFPTHWLPLPPLP